MGRAFLIGFQAGRKGGLTRISARSSRDRKKVIGKEIKTGRETKEGFLPKSAAELFSGKGNKDGG